MKALLLVAGRGERYSGTSGTDGPKCLAMIGDRLLADFSLRTAANLEVEEVVLVVGHGGDQVREALGEDYEGIPLRYAVQERQKGLVHAMSMGREALDGSEFWLFLGDEVLVGADHCSMQKTFEAEAALAICGMVPTRQEELIRRNYTINFEPRTREIIHLIEKPEVVYNQFIGTGNCIFGSGIFHYDEVMPVDPKTGRKELAGLIQSALDRGEKILCEDLNAEAYMNVNTYKDFLEVEETLKAVKA